MGLTSRQVLVATPSENPVCKFCRVDFAYVPGIVATCPPRVSPLHLRTETSVVGQLARLPRFANGDTWPLLSCVLVRARSFNLGVLAAGSGVRVRCWSGRASLPMPIGLGDEVGLSSRSCSIELAPTPPPSPASCATTTHTLARPRPRPRLRRHDHDHHRTLLCAHVQTSKR